MKFLVTFFMAVACVVAEPGLSEWNAEYGAYPTGHVVKLNYDAPIVKYDAPIVKYDAPFVKYDGRLLKYDTPILNYDPSILNYDPSILNYDPSILKYDAPMYYRLASKAYTLPAGYRLSYDPENFNEAFGFYPDHKK
ncbi:hypothetical protein MSG28_009893 [Choristoneura fumiferana]|nr:hypothetical protein MSG28_009893 [Choristoneura fumiferana]